MATSTKSSKLICWSIGNNDYGQQGTVKKETSHKLNAMPLPNHVDKINEIISCRNGSTYIIYNDNQLIVCGYNEFGQLGISIHIVINHWIRAYMSSFTMVIPMDVINLISKFFGQKIYDDNIFSPMEVIYLRVQYIARGISSSHQFVMTHDNNLYGIGNNDVQQLTFVSDYNEVYSFAQIHHFDNHDIKLKTIYCGYSFSTFLTENGQIYTSGGSCRGFKKRNKNDTSLAKIQGLKMKIIDICCGSDHTLALAKCGAVQSWGYNTFGQLGHDNISRCDTPKIVKCFQDAYVRIITVACGGWHNVLLDKTGRIHCFGRNDKYQCGSEDEVQNMFCSDEFKNNDLRVFGIKCGLNHNVVKTNQDTYYLWGDNQFKQCLVFIDVKFVKRPTEFPAKNAKNKYVIQDIFPGYKETRVITTSDLLFT